MKMKKISGLCFLAFFVSCFNTQTSFAALTKNDKRYIWGATFVTASAAVGTGLFIGWNKLSEKEKDIEEKINKLRQEIVNNAINKEKFKLPTPNKKNDVSEQELAFLRELISKEVEFRLNKNKSFSSEEWFKIESNVIKNWVCINRNNIVNNNNLNETEEK